MMLGLYTLPQWVLLFFSYGFLGWVWESGYVSVRQKHWVNRGFLHGPVIPIYGFGAVAILVLCAPVAGSLPMLFFSGMFWATALEYATGWAMECMFHVRYWDYSQEKWNLNGYICLMASLCWGVFSVLLLRVIQPPVAGVVTGLSGPAAAMLAAALTLAFAADVIASTREALDLRRLLEQLSASREQIARLQRRLEIAGVFLQQDARPALGSDQLVAGQQLLQHGALELVQPGVQGQLVGQGQLHVGELAAVQQVVGGVEQAPQVVGGAEYLGHPRSTFSRV